MKMSLRKQKTKNEDGEVARNAIRSCQIELTKSLINKPI